MAGIMDDICFLPIGVFGCTYLGVLTQGAQFVSLKVGKSREKM
jgi:hypothetical protein